MQEFDLPRIGSDDALMRVEACGICGSDVDQYDGNLNGLLSLPMIPGHEPVGIVEEIEVEAERRWGPQAGDRVAFEPTRGVVIAAHASAAIRATVAPDACEDLGMRIHPDHNCASLVGNNRLMQIGQAGAPQYILSLDGIRLSGRVGSDAGCDRRCGEPMTVDGTT